MSLGPVRVAVVDSGIDAGHPQLAGRVESAFQLDASSNRFLPPKHSPEENADVLGHGTAVASVIARLAPNASLVDIRVFHRGTAIPGAAVLAGLRLALETRVRVINLSLALKAAYVPELWSISEQAYRQNQIIIAARRNMPMVENGFPAEFSSCIGVDRDTLPTPYHVRYRPDQAIEFATNGEEVKVAEAGGGYSIRTGTSFAAPAVSAFCSLLLGRFPDLRPFEIKTILKYFGEANTGNVSQNRPIS
jgi:subtilisin family serine protease